MGNDRCSLGMRDFVFFFFNDAATTEIYTLSLHDALPICDPDYTRMLGKKGYKYKLRSILKAAPGHLLIEADYVGAELYGMAIMSGDATMIDHATRNQLPEDHPNFYDIHSNVAVLAFGRSEEHTSELQSRRNLVCRLLLEKKQPHEQADLHS